MDLIIVTVFIAGVLSFFSPCIVPLVPVYIGILSNGNGRTKQLGPFKVQEGSLLRTFLFILGLSTSFVVMGLGMGALGGIIHNQWFFRIIGLIVILLGIHQVGIINFKFLNQQKKIELKRSRKGDVFSSFLLGLTFSFGWTPCVGSVLGMILGLSIQGGKALLAGAYMLVYSFGLTVPFLVITLFSGFIIQRLSKIEKALPTIKIVGGLVIIVMGFLLMFDKIDEVTRLFL